MRDLEARLAVIGAGPAGLAAALAAAQALRDRGAAGPGASPDTSWGISGAGRGAGPESASGAGPAAAERIDVVLIDAAPQPGGQIWRARSGVVDEHVAPTLEALAALGVRVLAQTRVAGALPGCTLLVDGPEGARRLHWQRLVLAGGARERLLPFPGWTLPGVFGAGGLQALVKGGWPIAGRRVLVAGTGPLLLAAASTLRAAGAQIVGLVDEAPRGALLRFAGALLRRPAKAQQAVRLAGALWGVRWRPGMRIVAAQGAGRLERVTLAPVGPGQAAGGSRRDDAAHGRAYTLAVECDALAAGWGLVANTELARMLGCALHERFGAQAVVVDGAQRTSAKGVFAAGEATGVAGAAAAVLQGRIAGAAAADELIAAIRGPVSRPAVPARRAQSAAPPGVAAVADARALAREHRFAAAVARTFKVPSELTTRLDGDTLVCRCEDVPWSALRNRPDLRSAKLATRCGMGHCQGRLCHDALSLITGATPLAPQLPLIPVPLGALLAIDAGPSSEPTPFAEPLS